MKRFLTKSVACALAVFMAVAAWGCNKKSVVSYNDLAAEHTVELCNFERWSPDFSICHISESFGKITQNSDERYVKTGTKSARVQPVNGAWMYFQTASETYGFDYSDFTYIDGVRTVIYNSLSEEKKIHVGLVSIVRSIYSFERVGDVEATLKPGWNEVEVPIHSDILSIATDLTMVEGVYYSFNDTIDSEGNSADFYFDSITLIGRYEPNSMEPARLEFDSDWPVDFDLNFTADFFVNEADAKLAVVDASEAPAPAPSGKKHVLNVKWKTVGDGGWRYRWAISAEYVRSGPLATLTPEQIEKGYLCFDFYNCYKDSYLVAFQVDTVTTASKCHYEFNTQKNKWVTVRFPLANALKEWGCGADEFSRHLGKIGFFTGENMDGTGALPLDAEVEFYCDGFRLEFDK